LVVAASVQKLGVVIVGNVVVCKKLAFDKLVQLVNAFVAIVVTELGIETEDRPEQPWNADVKILVNKAFVGNVMEDRFVQPLNALIPITATVLGIIIEDKFVQFRNALAPILATELGIVYDVITFPIGYWINVVFNLLNNTPLLSLQ